MQGYCWTNLQPTSSGVRIALLVTGHVREATSANSELRALQEIIRQRFGSCDTFGFIPHHAEISTTTWYPITKANSKVQRECVASLCDFKTLNFYDDVDLFSELNGKWGETNMDKRGVRSMWWAISQCFEGAVGGGYNWFIRLRSDNYKWGVQYQERLKQFFRTFPFEVRHDCIVACPPTALADDDVCFAAPGNYLASFLTTLTNQFDHWNTKATKHPEWVLPEICKQQGITYIRWT